MFTRHVISIPDAQDWTEELHGETLQNVAGIAQRAADRLRALTRLLIVPPNGVFRQLTHLESLVRPCHAPPRAAALRIPRQLRGAGALMVARPSLKNSMAMSLG
ncbi:hypothetical protein FA95DRAFT_1606581 [Auriscalpium vulgare]|uniref:Uncharacterized protein n=1 Tax=Auriscalpium vulgare TaxID=40419 RepID=A0ACB8RRZ3_9AGAM|nr:hypothetical protein FA95DRAFT_1606581 [Auriscalpium vulgare]